jgi:catalase
VDISLIDGLKNALEKEGASLEFVAPRAGEVKASDGSWIEVGQKIDSGPSVLYDAVVIVPSRDAIQPLTQDPAARDFVADAFAHAKFIGYGDDAMPLLEKVVGSKEMDVGFIQLKTSGDVQRFVQASRKLRFWDRIEKMHTK